MFVEILRGILFEHASVCRAVTVEEYRTRIASRASHEAEYARLCELWSRALRKRLRTVINPTDNLYPGGPESPVNQRPGIFFNVVSESCYKLASVLLAIYVCIIVIRL